MTFLGVGVYIRGQHFNQLQHLFTSKKTTVFSNCLLFRMGACINWSNSESQCGITKTSTKESERPFLFSLIFFFVGRLIFFFTSAEERGISDFCAVTWLDGDRHLKRWHSAGPMTTATHDEEETCMQRLWSFDPPLSANTRWSTEPPWIL